MEVFIVSNYQEIIKIINEINLKTNNGYLLRGDSNPLLPSIAKQLSHCTLPEIIVRENLIFEEFKTYYHHASKCTNEIGYDWDLRIAAREFGLLSSLMDWTNNLVIATEFAIHKFIEKKISYTSLYVMKKLDLKQIIINYETKTDSFNEISEPTIVSLGQYSETTHWHRKFIQGGFFLKQPYQNICISLDKNPEFESRLVQIIIPKNVVGNVWKKISQTIDLDSPAMLSKGPSDKTLGQICDALNNKYSR